jgi:ABC-2 type transport system permease protein
VSPRRIRAVVGKEAREVVRDPVTLGGALLMPLVMLFLFGYAISLDVEDVPLGVLDQDRTPASRALVDAFAASGYFALERSFLADGEIEEAFRRNRIKVALAVPPRFQAMLTRGEPAPVQVLVDGTFSATALLAASYAQVIAATFHREDRPPRVRVETRVWYNPALSSANSVVPGLFGVILMAFPPLLTALSIVREKESGSIQQIFASPLAPAEFIAGKLLPYGLIAFLQILLVMGVGLAWFEVPFRGSPTFLLAAGLVYVFCTVGIGLLVSTVTRSQLAAMLLALIVTLMPSFLFSGFLFPIFTMPYVFQLYAQDFPASAFIELSRGIVLKGADLAELWPNLALLAAYTAVVFVIAVWRFRKKVA